MYTKKKLIKDAEAIIKMIWKVDPPTENPYNWEMIELFSKHIKELKEAKDDQEALKLATEFKERHKEAIRSLMKHLTLIKILNP